MSPMESQITGVLIVYSKLRAFVGERASNAENTSIWWRHHEWHPLVPEHTPDIKFLKGMSAMWQFPIYSCKML